MTTEEIRTEILEKFPSILEVQLHGFGGEVDELFEVIFSLIEKHYVSKVELEEVLGNMKKKDSPYIRNHGMEPHPSETLTNASRIGYNECIDDFRNRVFLSK